MDCKTVAFAPYDPKTGKIYVDKTASRKEDIPAMSGVKIVRVVVSLAAGSE